MKVEEEFSLEGLMTYLVDNSNVDGDHNIRRISIIFSDSVSINGNRNTVTNQASAIGSIIDEFLLERPWWLIEKEPYSW